MKPQQKKLLEAVTNRILPSDDDLAVRAGVAAYVEAALGGPLHGGNRGLVGQGLELIDNVAEEDHGRSFVECSAEEQDGVLEQMAESEERAVGHVFQTLVSMILEGLLCDPSYGGNRHEVGWRHMGYGEVQPRPADCLEDVEP